MNLSRWSNTRTIAIALALQLMWLVLLAGDYYLGLDTGPLLTLTSLTFLVLCPGLLAVKALRLGRDDLPQTILLSIGLSMAFAMMVGLLLNTLAPWLGILRPLSTLPLAIALTLASLPLYLACYLRRRSTERSAEPVARLSPWPVAALLLLPLLGAAGAWQLTLFRDDALAIAGVVAIAATIIIAACTRFIPSRLYPLALYAIALCLLYQISLTGSYLSGFSDTATEYYFARSVVENGAWVTGLSSNINGMLSSTVLPGAYSVLTNTDVATLFKLLWPALFALAPVALYQAYRGLLGEKVSLLAVFFFIAMTQFFLPMPSMPRQELAELFLGLLILLILSATIPPVKRAALAIVFAAALVVSHYTVSYVLLIILAASCVLLPLWKWLAGRRSTMEATQQSGLLGGNFALLFGVLALGWYIFVSGASIFSDVVKMGQHLYQAFATELLDPLARVGGVLPGLGLRPETNALHDVGAAFFYATELCIIIGAVVLVTGYRRNPVYRDYSVLSLAALGVIGLAVVVPYFARYLMMDRLYHLTLFFLAPLGILGIQAVFGFRLRSWRRRRESLVVGLTLAVLVPYFLFNIGLPYVLDDETSGVLGVLNMANVEQRGSNEEKAVFYDTFGYSFSQDVAGARWLKMNAAKGAAVYADFRARQNVLTAYGEMAFDNTRALSAETAPEAGSYVYLRYVNVIYGFTDYPPESPDEAYRMGQTTEINGMLDRADLVYDNGGCQIYFVR